MKISKKKLAGDILLIFGILILVGAFALIFRLSAKGGNAVLVKIDNKEIGTYSLAEDLEKEFSQGEGKSNTLIIKDGKAYITEATCPDKICAKHKAISIVGESIVCLPNRLTVTVISKENSGVDAVI